MDRSELARRKRTPLGSRHMTVERSIGQIVEDNACTAHQERPEGKDDELNAREEVLAPRAQEPRESAAEAATFLSDSGAGSAD